VRAAAVSSIQRCDSRWSYTESGSSEL